METREDNFRAIALTVLLHAGLVLSMILASWFVLPDNQASAAGEPMQASLQFSAADLRRAKQAVQNSPKPAPVAPQETTPPPQPLPSPNPQTSDMPLQTVAQAPRDQPDTVNQQAIDRNAQLKAEQEAREQEERIKQDQVDLTEDVARQQEVERRQRLRQQYEAIKAERELAERRTRMEEQRLAQLADAQPLPTQAPTRAAPTPRAGNRGEDEGLRARYIAALNATARANWNTSAVPQLIRCSVRFSQIPGGEVINVEFTECQYDAQGRESIERALRKTPMPYSGFESVFQSKVTLTMCYPEEACQR
ncbi:membrane protein TolA [Arenimonas oryziterrae]|uniref:Protein TolA n=1 Tax=Arenimonas oryziterrae DSM 21050 = YC6267 TaxID=1121015 RepID=A0A091BFD6_9GAMM|nr:membrane protein TolA [Arenimonas oryziterrae]KFN43095.1 hypothetical protein N789_11070 [Arenimonas oryziterrae DSM 21050 = YC6267]